MRLGNCFPPCPVKVGHNICTNTENVAIPSKLDCASLEAIHFVLMSRMQSMVQNYEYLLLVLNHFVLLRCFFTILQLTYFSFCLTMSSYADTKAKLVGCCSAILCINVRKTAYPLIKTDN